MSRQIRVPMQVFLQPEWFDSPFSLLEGSFAYDEDHDHEGEHMYSFKHGKHHVEIQINRDHGNFHDIGFSVNGDMSQRNVHPKEGRTIAHKIQHVVANHIKNHAKSGDQLRAAAYDDDENTEMKKHKVYGHFFRSLEKRGLGKHITPGDLYDRGPSYGHSFVVKEEAPTNSVAAGGVPSLTDHSVVPPKARKKWKLANAKGQGILRRQINNLPIAEGKFAGMKTFIVPASMVENTILEKRKHKHWIKYLESDPIGRAIREYANTHPDAPIILECEKTGYMVFARYGKRNSHK